MAEEVKNVNLINVESKKTDRAVSFERDLGQSLDDAVTKFGEDVVFSIYHAQAVVKAQSAARRVLDIDTKSEEDAVTAGASYTPGVVVRRTGAKKDPIAAAAALVKAGDMSKAELIRLINEQLA